MRVPSLKRRARWPWLVAGLGGIAFGAAGFVWLERHEEPAPPPSVATSVPERAAVIPVLASKAAKLPLETEAAILARQPERREAYRFAVQPEIVVLQFPDLSEQGRMLNRVAALIEKAGFPRDRVLGDAELDRLIRAGGDTPESFYLGHDYRAEDVLRFFVAADRDGVALNAEEAWLRQAVETWDWQPGSTGALITLTRTLPEAGVDAPARATILRHELSHGAYFTRTDYNAFVHTFWSTQLTRAEQAAFRAFLTREGYDKSIDDLMINEMQAYLMHTADPRIFQPGEAGLSSKRLETLRILFLTGMPQNWLRDCTVVPSKRG